MQCSAAQRSVQGSLAVNMFGAPPAARAVDLLPGRQSSKCIASIIDGPCFDVSEKQKRADVLLDLTWSIVTAPLRFPKYA